MYKQFIISMNRRGAAPPLVSHHFGRKVYVYWTRCKHKYYVDGSAQPRCVIRFGIKWQTYAHICAHVRPSVRLDCARTPYYPAHASAFSWARNDRRTHTPLRDPPRLCKCALSAITKGCTNTCARASDDHGRACACASARIKCVHSICTRTFSHIIIKCAAARRDL